MCRHFSTGDAHREFRLIIEKHVESLLKMETNMSQIRNLNNSESFAQTNF